MLLLNAIIYSSFKSPKNKDALRVALIRIDHVTSIRSENKITVNLMCLTLVFRIL